MNPKTPGQPAEATANDEIRRLLYLLGDHDLKLHIAQGLGGEQLLITDQSELNVWEGRDFTWLYHAKGLLPALCRLKQLEPEVLALLKDPDAWEDEFVLEI